MGLGPVQCADVTRNLHSVGEVADTDKDVLFTRGECVVVPGGSLMKYVKMLKLRVFARYTRKGKGLYTTRMVIRAPKPKAQGFGGSGATQ